MTKQGPAGKVMAGGFIHTALVTVQNSNSDHKITARAALDSCSSHSLLSEAMASFLALKREPLDVTISGAVAQQQLKHCATVQVSTVYSSAVNIPVEVAIAFKLPAATPRNILRKWQRASC